MSQIDLGDVPMRRGHVRVDAELTPAGQLGVERRGGAVQVAGGGGSDAEQVGHPGAAPGWTGSSQGVGGDGGGSGVVALPGGQTPSAASHAVHVPGRATPSRVQGRLGVSEGASGRVEVADAEVEVALDRQQSDARRSVARQLGGVPLQLLDPGSVRVVIVVQQTDGAGQQLGLLPMGDVERAEGAARVVELGVQAAGPLASVAALGMRIREQPPSERGWRRPGPRRWP